ncbi:biotin--[acetyl-CoA-carboxylase] ligase [uncultured Duncaniella sp.]|uniref:biotin--[acetyl-CoA-carboxylase] ligase n=1 Tax=uncultured Duncaniella sp. TaxID=2768039 RepID=UPI0026584E7E|nr:biotin--[acetyl-CoA-carboxylase] ligase [uncultured Duncaniella sp.]
MEIIKIESTDSTSSHLAGIAEGCAHGTAVMARVQTAGRGQRGNSWEAEPGMNITLSLLLRPEGLEPARQFIISQAVSLAIVEMLDNFIGADAVSIKWPNDIYVNDSKIAGILIENVISGSAISRSIVGVGLNVNQTEFLSDAPNPVSLKQLLPKLWCRIFWARWIRPSRPSVKPERYPENISPECGVATVIIIAIMIIRVDCI